MAPIKFEDQLKNKLENRRIQPSDDAWNRLERGLGNQSQKDRIKPYWWLGIAAGFVGILVLITFSIKNQTQTNPPQIVDSEVIEADTPKDKDQQDSKVTTVEHSEAAITEKHLNKRSNTAPKQPIVTSGKTVVAVAIDEKTPTSENENTDRETLSFEDQKAIEVAAQIKAMQESQDSINEAEIDALLAEAQKEIKLKKLYDEANNKVDAQALLESVEYDLEKSFREKVFEALKDSYRTVKTAVAERNN